MDEYEDVNYSLVKFSWTVANREYREKYPLYGIYPMNYSALVNSMLLMAIAGHRFTRDSS